MKRILGLDLGTTSIGWAQVEEGKGPEESKVIQIGSRVISLNNFKKVDKRSGKISNSMDPEGDFAAGKGLSPNASRTSDRGYRRNLQRLKIRREDLIETLKRNNIINDKTPLVESGKNTTFATWELRAKAVTEKVEKEELARIFLAINKKRGYKSSRKAKNEEEGQAIDGMTIARKLYDESLTPGELVFDLLWNKKKHIPDFYRSDLQNEFDKIWNFQKQYHSDILTEKFYEEIKGQGQRSTATLFWKNFGFNTADIKDLDKDLKNIYTVKLSKRDQKKLQAYKWRKDAQIKELDKEIIAFVFADINNNLRNSSGYLGAISDRSKELYFDKLTIGQYLYKQLKEDRHTSLKNKVFYRQDYLDEFEKIWETQTRFHSDLTDSLKEEIRDTIIFYQRKLKSQKGLINICELEQREVLIEGEKKIIGPKVAPRSSPLFQEFKIWQILNNVLVRKKGSKKRKATQPVQIEMFEKEKEIFTLGLEDKQLLFNELNIKGTLTSKVILELLGFDLKEWEINYTKIEGNHTNQLLYESYLKILEIEGYDVKELLDIKSSKDEIILSEVKLSGDEIKNIIKPIFETLEINTEILEFDGEIDGNDFIKQPSYELWHILYSYEGDNSISGNEKLYNVLQTKYGFSESHARILSNIAFLDDYGSLSSRAIKKIFPFIKENIYSDACKLAGYRHSKHSLTSEELEERVLKDKLELLSKNSLRNPVVEKILNQMINLVNALILKNSKKDDEGNIIEYFKFDEIRIELARELKKNADERAEMTTNINEANQKYEKIREILRSEFGLKNPTRNDITRYRLYEELGSLFYKDIYTNQFIPREILFSKQIDIEHIIPQSKLFDDSFSNKTIVYRQTNLDKGNMTAFDFIESKYGEEGLDEYVKRVESLFELNKKNKEDGISKAKMRKLLMPENDIGDGFIERDLRETQYITKKAKEILFGITRSVVSSTGSVTNKLREDWGLIDVMKEINLPKYRALGLTKMEERKYDQKVEVIEDWTKRNDHRHHAMDALTVAFTKHNHIQYLNYLNARKNERHKLHKNIIAIETLETELKENGNGNKKRVFKSPMLNFRQEAKKHLESVLISHKAKNKVVTRNKNKIKTGKGEKIKIELTPRGQLHKETLYKKYNFYETKEVKINSKFDEETINKVVDHKYKKLLLERLSKYGNDPKKAFSGKNSLNKNPILLDSSGTEVMPDTVKLVWFENDFSIRKDINPDNFKTEKLIDKVIDRRIRKILKQRFLEFGKDPKKAFSDLDKNPIWLNQEKGISIKRVRISGVSNAIPLHNKKDHFGNLILDDKGQTIPVDFVSTGNNHHVAIYKDQDGNLQEKVVSFFEAVERVNQGLPIIDKTYNQSLGWEFQFSMKQNEMFVFPSNDFDFNEVDLLNPDNKSLISPNLFRVQKISTKNYLFANHLETKAITGDDLKSKKMLSGISYYFLQSEKHLGNIIKVRLNNLGEIIQLGEY